MTPVLELRVPLISGVEHACDACFGETAATDKHGTCLTEGYRLDCKKVSRAPEHTHPVCFDLATEGVLAYPVR